jgi:site-specific DNA-methyltransferase (adenine-specific)/adenine-specific DNA-methyltransferase
MEQLVKAVEEGRGQVENICENLTAHNKNKLYADEKVAINDIQNIDACQYWYNRLIYGDNLLAMQALLAGDEENGLSSMSGKIDLIYIDPPFDSKADYRTKIKLLNGDLEQIPSIIEQFAYSDTWKDGTTSYLRMLYSRLVLMKELLSDKGSICIHTDWHVGSYLRVFLDEIFNKANFINEIIWSYKVAGISRRYFARKHDTILWYSKYKDKYSYNEILEKSYHKKLYNYGEHYKEYFDEEEEKYY